MDRRTIDLNCDLAEDSTAWARDLALLDLVSSANLACGGHAGDEVAMRRAVRAAAERGVAIGAHPGYPDREHFGRRELEISAEEIAEAMAAQVGAVQAIAVEEGARLTHVKPHGALYHRAAGDERVAAAIAEGVARIDGRLPIYGLAGSRALEVWRRAGVLAVAEAFADRRYEPDGTLRARAHPDALISDPAAAAEQAVRLAGEGWVEGVGGGRVAVEAATLCIHADTPGALAIARAVRRALVEAGIAVRSGIKGV